MATLTDCKDPCNPTNVENPTTGRHSEDEAPSNDPATLTKSLSSAQPGIKPLISLEGAEKSTAGKISKLDY